MGFNTNNAIKQRAVSGVASGGPGMRRVESVRESFRSTSSRSLGRGSSGELDSQPDGLDHSMNHIDSSNPLAYLIPNGGGVGAGNTERNIDFNVK